MRTAMIGVTMLHQVAAANGSAPASRRSRPTRCELRVAMSAAQIASAPRMPRTPAAWGGSPEIPALVV